MAQYLSYGPQDVVYYHGATHQSSFTPAEMYQLYPTPPPPADATALAAVMHAVAASLGDSRNHYLVRTTFFDSPTGPVVLGVLHLHASTCRNLEVGAQGFTCDVLLHPAGRRGKSRVRVDYAQV